MRWNVEDSGSRAPSGRLKQTVARPQLRPSDRVFWAWLSRLWPSWQGALQFVQPRTVIAWQHRRFREHWRCLSQRGSRGRPALAKEVQALIRAMWQANPTWGSPRIVGELRKLGIEAAKSTVEKYRTRPKQPPSPTWKTFLKNHMQDLVALDFFVVPTHEGVRSCRWGPATPPVTPGRPWTARVGRTGRLLVTGSGPPRAA
jgi:hypothetical protein